MNLNEDHPSVLTWADKLSEDKLNENWKMPQNCSVQPYFKKKLTSKKEKAEEMLTKNIPTGCIWITVSFHNVFI